MQGTSSIASRPLVPGLRRMLLVAGGLVFIVGIQLFVLTTMTERFFSWTINPPLTAAFMGAAYWSSCVLEWSAARERSWTRARVGVPAVLTFTTLTLIVTLIHIENFHLDTSIFPWYTVALTWVWILVYALVPPILGLLLLGQLRQGGSDMPRQHRLPHWLRGLLICQAAVMLVVGALLLLVPTLLSDLWPWALSALTGRTIGAWLVGLGLAAGHMAWENAFERISAGLASMLVFVGLQAVALLRFPADLRWDAPQSWFYLAFLGSLLVVGLAGLLAARPSHTTTASSQADS